MTTFDNRTAFILIALLYLVLPIFSWITLAAQRQRAVALWCCGGVLLGTGFLMVGLRGRIPDLGSYAGANLLLAGGMLLRVQALRLDLGIAWRARWLAIAAGVYLCAYEAIQMGVQDEGLRLRLVYLLYLIMAGLVLHLVMLARRISRRENSPSANWIAGVYFLVVVALLLRHILVFSGNGAHVLAPELVTQIFSVTILLAAVVGHIGYVGLALDRSMRREIEVASDLARNEVTRRLGGKIAHLDRQRILGSMSASLGQELNQPLTVILMNAQMVRRGMQAENFELKQAALVLEQIVASVHSAGQIIERIRGFIVPSLRATDVVDIEFVVQEVLALAAEDAKSRGVKLYFIAGAQSASVMGDAIQFSQVILNVVRNGLEAVCEVARREIHLSTHLLEGRVLLRIRDTGPGMDARALAQTQTGQPFFTTKTTGLGMGLLISRSIMEQFGGRLKLQNLDEGGVLVELEWPARSGSADLGPSWRAQKATRA